ncbi:MAG TPA: DUF3810 family protein [Candidatus Baltobacteraceae bacterium]|nr:DUF3810 family protein [Candidatus Baltobacteraceae bacterium]
MTTKRAARRGSFTSYTLPLDIALIVFGAIAAFWRPSATWIEQRFTNGYYPAWQHFWSSFTPAVPFAAGDAVIAAGVAIIVLALLFGRPWWRTIVGIAAVAGFYAIWFYAGWGFGYDRAPVQARMAYSSARVSTAQVDALRARAIAEMNRLAPLAHAQQQAGDFDIADLRAAWLPVVQRLGDDWTPNVHAAKPAAAGWFMNKSGTSGFTNPFTLETQLAPDLLWFERPFSQAHEWGHVAGFNREDEANYIAVLACLRDRDVAGQYSGWLELFLYLPPKAHYAKREFVPEVWADFAAIRKRNAQFVNLNLSRFSWRLYNSYLKTNHIASGVENYNQVTRLVIGIPLDAQGLPLAAASGKSASTPRGNK